MALMKDRVDRFGATQTATLKVFGVPDGCRISTHPTELKADRPERLRQGKRAYRCLCVPFNQQDGDDAPIEQSTREFRVRFSLARCRCSSGPFGNAPRWKDKTREPD